jgi:hypothetical protein
MLKAARAAVLVTLVGCTSVAQAEAVLLTPALQSQMLQWLGQGTAQLSNVFTKKTGDTAAAFHAAVDGKGATFSLMQVRDAAGNVSVIGGYNPQSWESSGAVHTTVPLAERTAFIFNATTGFMYRQMPKSPDDGVPDYGAHQTDNCAVCGPSFGAGADLLVGQDLTTGGNSYLTSYYSFDPGAQPFGGSIVGSAQFTYMAMEVYSISAVPELSTMAMLLAGMGVLAYARRKASRS